MRESKKMRKSRKKDAKKSLNGRGFECCMNPWNGECRNTDIQIYIFYRHRRRPICRSCWEKIAKGDYSWNSLGKRT